MSLFGDIDLQNVNDDPWTIVPDTYRCVVSKVEVGPTNNGDKVGMTISYKIIDGGFKGRSIQEWKWVPTKQDMETSEGQRAATYLAERLTSFGIPAERRNSVTSADLVGLDVLVTTFNKDDNTRIRKVVLDTGDSPASSASGSSDGLSEFAKPSGLQF